jgi:hypothetical protein
MTRDFIAASLSRAPGLDLTIGFESNNQYFRARNRVIHLAGIMINDRHYSVYGRRIEIGWEGNGGDVRRQCRVNADRTERL